jgi:hypothetical protein
LIGPVFAIKATQFVPNERRVTLCKQTRIPEDTLLNSN